MPTQIPPLHREVRVHAPQAIAFDWFTLQIGRWWPRILTSFGGTMSFVDGQLEETSPDDNHTWGEVITWDRPRSLRMTWRQPSHGEDQRTDVGIQFVPDGIHTIVRVVHGGWDRVPGGPAAHKLYSSERGWREALASFETAIAARS